MAGTLRIANRSVWQFISGTGILRPKELVSFELKDNQTKISEGLLYYKKPQKNADKLKKERKVPEQQIDFVQKLSLFLGLDEVQTYDLFCSYLTHEYRSSEKNLKQILSNEQHTKGLILKIQDYYFSERLYLMCCLKYIISNGQEMSQHPYQDVYEEFLVSLQTDDKLIKSLEEQHNVLCDADIPTWETHGTLMNKKHSMVWVVQNLKEQCEVLECLLISFGDLVECDLTKFMALLNKFKNQGFGRWQKFQHLLDESFEKYLKKIEFLEIIIILKCLDFDLIQIAAKNKSFEHHPLFKDPDNFKELDKCFCGLSTLPTHGPLLLGWAVARCYYMEGEDERTTRKLGSQALQLDALNYICTLLKSPHFAGNTVISSVAYCTVYTLVCALLDQFQEDTIGGVAVLCSVISQLLSKPSIANDMWAQGLEEGVGSFYQLAKDQFPFKFSPLIQLSTTLAAAGPQSALKVVSTLKSLPTYLENFDKSISAEYQQMDDMTLCQLSKDRKPYVAGNFIIPAGTYGHQHLETATKGGQLVQWVFTYNCWKVLTCEIQELLFQVSRSPNMITADQTCQASQVVSLVKSVLSNVPQSIDHFQDILDLCYQVIHRFAGLTSPPLDLIAVCVETLTQVAKKHPHKVWQNIKQTGLLPYFTEHLGNTDVFSSKGLRPGMYGTFLAGFECPQGRYPLSLAFLDFISTVVMDLSQVPVDDEISATVLFILTEVFPSFYKWRYYNATRREAIGHKCLEIFHEILDVMAKPKVVSKKKLPNLQKMCVHNLLYTEAGQSLLNVISIGVDAFNDTVTEQGGFFENKSTELIDLIQISFSVLNRLLLLKAPDLPVSPVERALSLPAASQQEQHIVLTVAQYIYHQHAPKLPTMAILLLKRLAVVSPMSILAILGNHAEPIKDKMLSRLSAVTEDLQLKVAILELLSVCVVTQPGLIELFLNLKLEKPNKEGKKELLLGNSSCLKTVMNLIMSEKQKTYQCPPNLLCACIEFLHALWGGMRETAMSVLRKIDYFWPSICEPLKRNIGDEKDENSEEAQLSWLADIKTVAYVFMILAHESYSVPRDKVEESFKAEMAVLSKENRIQYWSEFIRKSLTEVAKKENMDAYLTADTLKDDPILLLLKSWKNWLITITKLKIPGVTLKEELKMQILSDLLSSIQCLVKDNISVYNLKLACIASATYFTIITSWVGSMNKWSDILEDLQLALDTSFSNKECLIPAVQIGLVASLTTLLQLPNQEHVNISDQCLISLLRVVCSMLLECVRNLFPVQIKTKSVENADPTNTVAILQGKQQTRIKLLMTSVLLLQEIILNLDDPSLWIPVLHNHLLIPTLLTTIQVWIQAKQGLPFVDSALTLLLTISKTEQGAKILMSAEVANHLCLSISSLYSAEDLQQKLLAFNRERSVADSQNWDNVFCLSVDLYASMLTTLKYSFLKEALDFIGVHQDRLLQSLELARINLTEPVLKEAHATCRFIYQMSFYARDWKFHLPKVLSKLMTSLVYMCQTFVSLLVRPRYLQHILEHTGPREDLESKRQGQLVTPISAFLQHSSHDDLEQPSAQCLKVQKNILNIIGICLSSLRQFTPDLCEMLMDQSMDISQYDPFLAIGFNAPSIDQDAQPTFGTLLACINMCMMFLPKVDPRAASPQKGNESIGQVIPKNLVLFVLENSLLLIMSQACRYLKEPSLSARDKQMLKRELSADLNTFLQSMHRHMRKGTTTPVSPCGPTLGTQSQQPSTSPTGNFSMGRTSSQGGFSSNFDQGFYRLVSEFVAKVLR